MTHAEGYCFQTIECSYTGAQRCLMTVFSIRWFKKKINQHIYLLILSSELTTVIYLLSYQSNKVVACVCSLVASFHPLCFLVSLKPLSASSLL